jgi:hypothetical protein
VMTRGPRQSASAGWLAGPAHGDGPEHGSWAPWLGAGALGQAGPWPHGPVRLLGPVEAEMAIFHFLVYPKSFLFLFLVKSRPLICKYICATCVLVLRGRL